MRALGVLVVVGGLAAQAQVPADLEQFLRAADAQNLDGQIAVENRERAAAEFTQAWTSLLPAITATGAWTHNQFSADFETPNPATGMLTRVVIIPEDQLDGVIRVDLPLVDVARWVRVMSAGAVRNGAVERAEATRDLVRRQVVGTYYGYAAALAVAQSAARSLEVAEAQLKVTEIRAQAGTVTELDVLRARSEVQRNRQLVADTRTAAATTRRSLETLTRAEVPARVDLPAPNLAPEPGLAELEPGVTELPQVQAAEADLAQARSLNTGATLAFIPTVNAQFTQRFTNATGFQGQSAVYNYGVNLTWRVDGPIVAGVAVLQRTESAARLAAERARLAARDQLFSDWQRFDAALIKVQAAEAQVEAARRAAQVARDRYAVGASTQVDQIQAERDLFLAEVNQIQARTELAAARLSVRISAGQPLVQASP